MAEVLSGLKPYVEEQRLPLIAKSVLGARSAKLLNLQTGVKGTAKLNLLNTAVVFGDGGACGWDEAGTSALTQREIVAVPLKVNMSFCDKAMLKYWTQSQVRIAADPEKALPFEAEFTKGIVDSVNAEVEKMIWQGTKASNAFDGLLTIAAGAGAGDGIIKVEGVGALAAVKAVYAKIPAAILAHEKTQIVVGTDAFRELVAELVEKNLTNYVTNVDEKMEIMLPGTNTKIVGVDGMIGTNKVFAADFDTVFYGTDMEGDEEVFDLWYSRDNQEYRLAINFNGGVQYAFPDQVVLGTINGAMAAAEADVQA